MCTTLFKMTRPVPLFVCIREMEQTDMRHLTKIHEKGMKGMLMVISGPFRNNKFHPKKSPGAAAENEKTQDAIFGICIF